MQTILGIDPGSRITGYGLIQSDGLSHHYVNCGNIRIYGCDIANKLQQIFDDIRTIIAQYQPDHVAVEQIFVHHNVKAALKLGQARGAAIVVAALHQIPVSEYSARQIKQAVVGYGAAKKQQVQHMMKTLLNLSDIPSSDAADALGVAICHAHASVGLTNMGPVSHIRKGRLR